MQGAIEQTVTTILGYLALLAEICGALVIVLGVLRTIVLYLAAFFRRGPLRANTLRIRLGQSMVMALEFQVAADILKTASYPTWNDILLLAALIALRTVLNYVLERELRVLGVDNPCATCDEPG
jgi:uncharacterized membrane protein